MCHRVAHCRAVGRAVGRAVSFSKREPNGEALLQPDGITYYSSNCTANHIADNLSINFSDDAPEHVAYREPVARSNWGLQAQWGRAD